MRNRKSSVKRIGAFSCTTCQFSSVCRRKLREHETKVHRKVFNILDCCGVRFTNRANLRQHMAECHPSRYKCNVCNREFSDSASRRRHEEIHSGKRKYKCSFCDYASVQKGNLDRHLKRHSNKDENFSQPKPGSLWFENSKGDCFICILCLYKTKQKSALNKHLKTMHKKVATNPKYRGNHFSSEAASQKDNATCDPQQNKNANCELVLGSQILRHQQLPNSDSTENVSHYCDLAPSRRDVNQYQKIYEQDDENTEPITSRTLPFKGSVKSNLFKCSLCPFSTKYPFNLKIHTTRMHKPSTKLLKCCGINFVNKSAFQNHKTNGSCRNNRYKWTDCSVSFLSKTQFRQHEALHSDKSQFDEDTLPSTEESTWHALQNKFPKGKVAETHSILISRNSRCTMSSREEISFSRNKEQENVHRNLKVEEKSKESSGKVFYETALLQHDPSHHPERPSGLLQTTSPKLQKHELSHPKEFTCNLCDHVSSWQGHTTHMMEHHCRNNPHLPYSSQRDKEVIDSMSVPSNDSYCKPLLQSFTGVTFNSIIHDEARQLRAQIPMTITVSKLLPLLERLLEMCSSIMTFIRGAVEIEARFRAIECFEFVWNISKIAFVRWEDLKGATDRNTWFNAVEFAYRILPVFLDLEKDEHLNMTEHIILLIINVVKNFQLPSLIRPEMNVKVDGIQNCV